MEIYVNKNSLISTFFFFLVFSHDFSTYTDFMQITASNTAFPSAWTDKRCLNKYIVSPECLLWTW